MIRKPSRQQRNARRAAVKQAMVNIVPFDMSRVYHGHWTDEQQEMFNGLHSSMRSWGMPTATAVIWVLLDAMHYLESNYKGSLTCQQTAHEALLLVGECLRQRQEQMREAIQPHMKKMP